MLPMFKKRFPVARLLVLMALILLTGCVTKKSLVLSSPYFHPTSSQEPLNSPYRFGLVLNQSIDMEIARFVTQQGGLTYDFEFRIGEDVRKTLPIYLNSFMDVVVVESFDEAKALNFVLDPKVTSSLFTYIGASAAPRYELSIGLDVPVMKDGATQKRFLVKNNSHVEISAFQNTDKTRTETMRLKYEEQIKVIYNELENQLRNFLKSEKPG